jgi:hypothetical protein
MHLRETAERTAGKPFIARPHPTCAGLPQDPSRKPSPDPDGVRPVGPSPVTQLAALVHAPTVLLPTAGESAGHRSTGMKAYETLFPGHLDGESRVSRRAVSQLAVEVLAPAVCHTAGE